MDGNHRICVKDNKGQESLSFLSQNLMLTRHRGQKKPRVRLSTTLTLNTKLSPLPVTLIYQFQNILVSKAL